MNANIKAKVWFWYLESMGYTKETNKAAIYMYSTDEHVVHTKYSTLDRTDFISSYYN